MIEVSVPGYGKIEIRHLVLDYNGTIACDGVMLSWVKACLTFLAEKLQVHVITADTFGNVACQLKDLPVTLSLLPPGEQDVAKLAYVKNLGCEHTVCIGNGRNDRLMLKDAALGIAVILEEGAALETVLAADMVFTDIVAALEVLMKPLRLTATLRT
jgi:soluble P-type ATPase